MRNFFFTVLMCVLAGTVAKGQAVDINKLPTIQTTGTAEINVVPDQAVLSMSVTKVNKDIAAAKAANDTVIDEVRKTTARFSIPAIDVKTNYITIREKFDRKKIPNSDDEFEQVFAGYAVSRNITVRLKDLTKFEALFSELVKTGISGMDSVVFETSKLREFKDQARAGAMKAAREKASAMAAEIGQSIGKAVSIEEKDIDGYRSPYANISRNNFSVSDDDDEPESFAIGSISIKAQVEAQFVLN